MLCEDSKSVPGWHHMRSALDILGAFPSQLLDAESVSSVQKLIQWAIPALLFSSTALLRKSVFLCLNVLICTMPQPSREFVVRIPSSLDYRHKLLGTQDARVLILVGITFLCRKLENSTQYFLTSYSFISFSHCSTLISLSPK